MASFDLTNKWEYSEDGVTGTAAKNATTSFDYKVTSSNIYLTGGEILVKNAEFGDSLRVELVDKDGVYYPANTVLRVYILKKYVDPAGRLTVENPYAGNPPVNTYLRLKYTSVGTVNDVSVAVNYYLHILL